MTNCIAQIPVLRYSFGACAHARPDSAVTPLTLQYIYFIYGLAFFSMGLAVLLEMGRADDVRLRQGLRPLAVFGLSHGLHEWLEMFGLMGHLPQPVEAEVLWDAVRLGLLAFSFLSLAEFGTALLAYNERLRRVALAVPLLLVAVWGSGALTLRTYYTAAHLWDAADVWTRYTLAVPSALMASAGLVAQQRAFRQAGLVRFGQDSLWAAVAFAWYGLVGQTFTRASLLWPSTVFNQGLFLQWFGFPIQLLRCVMAVLASVFVMRFLRSFQVETQRKISELQAARLEEAQRRETQRGELLRRVVTAQEAERIRIARELHDATGQALTALGLGLRGAANSLHHDGAPTQRQLQQLEELATHTLDELRHLIADLRPSHLDDLGLPAALRWYAKEVQARVPLIVQVELIGEQQPLSSALKTALFRVTQEALTNVIKHSGASHAWVRLRYSAREVSVQVDDNGRGFDTDAQAASARPAWGLLGMEERATLLGGRFLVSSRPGRGTHIEIVIPYQNHTLEAEA